jgi:TPR repeat protein
MVRPVRPPRSKAFPSEREKRRAQVYNQTGMALLALELDERRAQVRVGEQLLWCRNRLRGIDNDTLTYAFDTSDAELYQTGLEAYAETEAEIRELEQLPSLREEALRLAYAFFRRSAWLGDREGMWNLGWRLIMGEGVAPDPELALRWWSVAARAGHRACRDELEARGVDWRTM